MEFELFAVLGGLKQNQTCGDVPASFWNDACKAKIAGQATASPWSVERADGAPAGDPRNPIQLRRGTLPGSLILIFELYYYLPT